MIIRTYIDKQKEDLKTRVAVAHYTAALQRVKRLPKLEKVLNNLDKKSKPKRRMTSEEMLAVVKQLNAVLGGKEV